jgi:hypothetical protein
MSNEDIAQKEAEYNALLNERINKIKAEKDAEMKAQERKTLETEIRTKVEAELKNKNTSDGIQTSGSLVKGPSKNNLSKFYNAFNKKNGYTPIEYGSSKWLSGYEFTDSDTGCDNDISDWTPDETFANLIWSAFYCKGYLAGKVTVRGVDFTRGKGDTVSIRVRGKRTAQGPLDPCECLSCESQTFTKVSLELDSYGDLAEICELDLQYAGDEVKAGVIEDMADGLAEQVDLEIYSQLITASTSYTDTIDACCEPSDDDCCLDYFGRQLINSIIDLEAQMREGGYKPDFCIIAPSIAAHFKYKEAASMIGYPLSFSGNELSKIGNMSVIEFPCANVCDDSEAGVVAVILDSRRAVGEGWGMKPKLEQDRDIDCDSTTVAIHMYIGIDELDDNAIGLISSPSCS